MNAGREVVSKTGRSGLSFRLRNLTEEDFDQVIDLQKRVYPDIPAFRSDHLGQQLEIFPQGQFVVEEGDRIVGAASSLVVLWDDYGLHHTWKSVTGEGSFATHNMQGRTLYGAEVCVDPSIRKSGIGHLIYQARRRLCREMNLKRIIAAGRLPGYHNYANQMTAELYAQKVVWGDIYDPVLRFQLGEGFHYCGVIDGYLPTDADSLGNAALIVWLNPRYNPNKPTLTPPDIRSFR
ncbi:MAG: GNAT family N-acetyltransferase [Rhodocyclaceae bacterium]|nr:GNAT family N-acetyltransferase [Rhodocyclaceae bacterium]